MRDGMGTDVRNMLLLSLFLGKRIRIRVFVLLQFTLVHFKRKWEKVDW